MGKQLLLFVQSTNVGSYVNAITHCVRHENIEEIFFACSMELKHKKIPAIDSINAIRKDIERLSANHSEYTAILDRFPRPSEIESRIVWILFVKPHESLDYLKSKFNVPDLTVDVTGCSKRLATDVVTSFIAHGISHVTHFELADKVFTKEWSGSKMYHDLIRDGIQYYTYDDFSSDSSTATTLSLLKEYNALYRVAQRAISLLGKVKDGIGKLAKRHLSILTWLLPFSGLGMFLIMFFLWRKYGWEKMEPWTYFISGLSVILMLFYFAITKTEFAYSLVYEKWLKKLKQKYLRDAEFDKDEYKSLQDSLSIEKRNER